MSDDSEEDDSLPLRELERLWGGQCQTCAQPYRGQEAVFSVALGFKDAPRCLPCLARGLNRELPDLRAQLLRYVRQRECFARAWAEAERRESVTGRPLPEHLRSPVLAEPGSVESPAVSEAVLTTTDFWDAGDMACGELVLALRIRLNKLAPGTVLEVVALDPAAPEDLPAWCRMTGHALIHAQHPEYKIRRKES